MVIDSNTRTGIDMLMERNELKYYEEIKSLRVRYACCELINRIRLAKVQNMCRIL